MTFRMDDRPWILTPKIVTLSKSDLGFHRKISMKLRLNDFS